MESSLKELSILEMDNKYFSISKSQHLETENCMKWVSRKRYDKGQGAEILEPLK